MEVVIFIAWITFSLLIGIVGDDRKIGFWGAFLISVILSPLVGLIITMFSKTIKQQKIDDEILRNQIEQTRLLAEKTVNKSISITDELEKLVSLKEKGALSEDEFQQAKQHLINKL